MNVCVYAHMMTRLTESQVGVDIIRNAYVYSRTFSM